MQYLLTQEEWDGLVEGHKKQLDDLKDKLQEACSLAAEHMPVRLDDEEDEEGLQPWGCPRVTDNVEYCDQCPVQKLCPSEHKRYSK